jgi:MFS family permease
VIVRSDVNQVVEVERRTGIALARNESPPARRLPAVLRALQHRNYRLFFGGQFISLIGTWMQSVAQSWLVYRLTGSAELLGWIGFAGLIPVFLFAAIGGVAADRYHRHRILVLTQTSAMLLAAVLAALTLSHRVQVWHIFVLATLLGTVNAFDVPARQAFVVEMVGKEDLINAIALNSSMFNGARIVGPALAGVLVAAIGEGWCFLANSASYLAVIAGLLMMQLPRRLRRVATDAATGRMRTGFQFAWQARPVRALLLLLGVASFMGVPYMVLMPIFADRVLHGGANALGVLMAASGLGAFAGAATLATRRGVHGLGQWVAWSSAAFGFSLILFACSRVLWLSVLLVIPLGFSLMVQMASSNTLVQTMVPDELRGRVMAIYSIMFMGVAPFGSLFAGFAGERLGAPATVAAGGVVCVAGALLFRLRLPALSGQARELLITQGMMGGQPAAAMNAAVPIAVEEALSPTPSATRLSTSTLL